MTTVVSIILSDIIPLRDRGLWQGVINITYATGSGIGAPLGNFHLVCRVLFRVTNVCRWHFGRLYWLALVSWMVLGIPNDC
jgi:hypothetical protein